MSTMKCLALAVVLMTGMGAAALAADDGKTKKDDVKKEEPKKKDPKDMKADEAQDAGLCPVCKGEFKPVYHYEYKGKEYHFKTRQCAKDFAADPTKFGAVGAEWKSPNTEPEPPKKDPKKTK